MDSNLINRIVGKSKKTKDKITEHMQMNLETITVYETTVVWQSFKKLWYDRSQFFIDGNISRQIGFIENLQETTIDNIRLTTNKVEHTYQ
jgi:hypothetical protein